MTTKDTPTVDPGDKMEAPRVPINIAPIGQLRADVMRLAEKCDRLTKMQRELVAALRDTLEFVRTFNCMTDAEFAAINHRAIERARAALAKVTP
jgi:hypothetical protein